jgi:hypothetical protein
LPPSPPPSPLLPLPPQSPPPQPWLIVMFSTPPPPKNLVQAVGFIAKPNLV